jgi:hypothetical protein
VPDVVDDVRLAFEFGLERFETWLEQLADLVVRRALKAALDDPDFFPIVQEALV